MRKRRTQKDRLRNREIIRERVYTPYHGGCTASGCKREVMPGVGVPWCHYHRNRYRRHGHPTWPTITHKMRLPWIKEARKILHVRAEHKAHDWLSHEMHRYRRVRNVDQRWKSTDERVRGWLGWVGHHTRTRGQRYLRTRMMQRVTAVMLMAQHAGNWSDEYLHVQLARSVVLFGQAPVKRFKQEPLRWVCDLGAERVAYRKDIVIRQSVRLNQRDLRYLGKQLHDGLVPLLPVK